jgi:hypothetical protein
VALSYLNDLLGTVSRSHSSSNGEPGIEVIGARIEFINLLTGLDAPSKEILLKHVDDWEITRRSIIGSQRLLQSLKNVNNQAVVNSFPRIISLDPDILKFRMDNITKEGLKLERVVNKFAPALGLTTETFNSKLKELTDMGLNASRVATVYPRVLGMSRDEIRYIIRNFTKLGLDAIKLINEEPNMLRPKKVALVEAKKSALGGFGLKPILAANNFPPIVTEYAPEFVNSRMESLRNLNLDAVAIMNSFPKYALTLRPVDFAKSKDTLNELGLDATIIINTNAAVATKPKESIGLMMDDIKKLGLDPVKVINGCPSLLNNSAKALSVRHRVLLSATRAWGVKDYTSVTNELINQSPSLLNYTSDRLRVLMRILSNSLQPGSKLEIPELQNLVRYKLETTVLSYLELKDHLPVTPGQIISKSSSFRKMEIAQLLNRIFESKYASDSVVKTYRRSRSRNNKQTERYHEHI